MKLGYYNDFKKWLKLPKLTYLYVLYVAKPDFPVSILHLFRYKIGISNDVKGRCKGIAYSIYQETKENVIIRPLIYVPLFTAHTREQWLHRKMKRVQASKMYGSGYTEWFWWANILTPILFYLTALHFGINWSFISFFWLVLLPLPLDFALCVIIILLIESTLVVGTFLTLIFLTYKFF